MYLFLISILFYKTHASCSLQGMLYATFENETGFESSGREESHI